MDLEWHWHQEDSCSSLYVSRTSACICSMHLLVVKIMPYIRLFYITCCCAVPIIDWPTGIPTFSTSAEPNCHQAQSEHHTAVLKQSKIKLKSQINMLLTEPVLPRSIDCLQWPQPPRALLARKSSCCHIAGLTQPGSAVASICPLLQYVPDLWRRRSGPAAVSAALCMVHCNQQCKECSTILIELIHFFSTLRQPQP